MRIVKLVVAIAIPFALVGCPDNKPNPDPAAAAKDAGTATTKASAAAPAKSGGGW